MQMTDQYSILFSIDILHEYFLNRKCRDIEIVPADDCKEISRKMNILWRNPENQLVALTKVNGNNEPFINVSPHKFYRKHYDRKVFRFYLKTKNPLFSNFNNIHLSCGPVKKLYFSNAANNNQNGNLYLTTPVKDYISGTTYFPGDLAKDPATGNVYESITKHTSKKKNNFSDASFWAPKGLLHSAKTIEDYSVSKTYFPGDLVTRPGTDNVFEAIKKYISRNDAELDDAFVWAYRANGQLQYATDNDCMEYCSSKYIFKVVAPVTKAEIVISGFNYDNVSPAYNVPVRDKEVKTFKEPATQVAVDLSVLDPGKYEIKINQETKTVYYDPFLNTGNILGVIEIFNHFPGTDNYAFLDEDEKIKNVKYVIQFANRRVLWKYKPKDGKAEKITDTGDTEYIFKLDKDAFVSATPIPLSQSVFRTLKLEFNTKDYSLFPLPNPDILRLVKCTQNDYDYLCSEVYLNY